LSNVVQPSLRRGLEAKIPFTPQEKGTTPMCLEMMRMCAGAVSELMLFGRHKSNDDNTARWD
jgi:hypothetical protein